MGIILGSSVLGEDFLKDVAPTYFQEETSTVIECTLNFVNELNADWSSFTESLLIKELAVLESTGSEMIYESFDAAAFIQKIKDFFTTLWSKFMGIIKKWYTSIDDFLHDTRNFMKKYKDDFIKGAKNIPANGIAIKGYSFTGLPNAVTNIKNANTARITDRENFDSLMKAVDAAGTKDNATAYISTSKDEKDSYEKTINKILGSPTGDIKTFNEDVKKFYFGEKITSIKSVDTGKYIDDVTSAQSAKKEVRAIYEDFKKAINAQIKDVNGWKKELDKSDELISLKISVINVEASVLRMIKTKTATTVSIILSALSNKLHQDKEVIKRVAALAKKDGKNDDQGSGDGGVVGESSTADFESSIFGFDM